MYLNRNPNVNFVNNVVTLMMNLVRFPENTVNVKVKERHNVIYCWSTNAAAFIHQLLPLLRPRRLLSTSQRGQKSTYVPRSETHECSSIIPIQLEFNRQEAFWVSAQFGRVQSQQGEIDDHPKQHLSYRKLNGFRWRVSLSIRSSCW